MEQRGKGQERKDGNWVTRVKTALRSGTPDDSDAAFAYVYTQRSVVAGVVLQIRFGFSCKQEAWVNHSCRCFIVRNLSKTPGRVWFRARTPWDPLAHHIIHIH